MYTCVTTSTIKILEHFHLLQKFRVPHHSVSLPPLAPRNHRSAFCHYRLVLSRLSCNWNHTVCMYSVTLLSLASFTEHSLRSTHVVYMSSLLHFIDDKYSIEWLPKVCLPADRHLGCFLFCLFVFAAVSFLTFLKTLESKYYFCIFQMRKLRIRSEVVQGSPA